MKNKITGIILAGGKSTRMGTDKALLQLNGKPVIQHIYHTLKPICSEIIVSANSDDYSFLHAKIIHDIYPECGPISGVFSALKASSTEKNIIISCDTPFISKDLFEILLVNSENSEITVFSINNQIQPLIGVYSKNIIWQLENDIVENKLSLLHFIENIKSNIINLKFDNEDDDLLFFNLNNQDDFQKANSIFDKINSTVSS